MPVSLYEISIPVFIRSLTNLAAILKKGEAYADEKGIPHSKLLESHQRYLQGRRRAHCRHRARRNGRYRNDIRGPASKDPEDDRISPGRGGNEYGWQGGVAGGPGDQVRSVQFYGDGLPADLCSPELLLSRRDGLWYLGKLLSTVPHRFTYAVF